MRRHWGAGSGQGSPSWRMVRRPPPRPLTGAAHPPPPAGCSGCWRTGGGGAGSVHILSAPRAAPAPSGRSLKETTGQSQTISFVWQSCRQVKYGDTWPKSSTYSTWGPETDMFRPGIEPGGRREHSSKELFEQPATILLQTISLATKSPFRPVVSLLFLSSYGQ